MIKIHNNSEDRALKQAIIRAVGLDPATTGDVTIKLPVRGFIEVEFLRVPKPEIDQAKLDAIREGLASFQIQR